MPGHGSIDPAFVVVVPVGLDEGLSDALFWASVLGGFAPAFGPAFLVKRANIRRGRLLPWHAKWLTIRPVTYLALPGVKLGCEPRHRRSRRAGGR